MQTITSRWNTPLSVMNDFRLQTPNNKYFTKNILTTEGTFVKFLIFSLQSRNDKNCLPKNLKRFIIPFRVIWRPTRVYARSARRRRTSDESLADFKSRLQTVFLLNSHLNLVGARDRPLNNLP